MEHRSTAEGTPGGRVFTTELRRSHDATIGCDSAFGSDHSRIDASRWEDIFVVGDVHGCRKELGVLLERINPGARDLVIFVGDLVRKGPDSKGVVDIVRERDNLRSVRGNNEEKLLRGDASVEALTEDDLAWIADLPAAVSWGNNLVVHGGVHPERPLSSHDAEMLQTMRAPTGDGYDGPFWFDSHRGPPRVFFGHTVLEAPVEREWSVGLDTGCVHGRSLTAYDCTRERIVSVEATTTYQERSPENVVALDALSA